MITQAHVNAALTAAGHPLNDANRAWMRDALKAAANLEANGDDEKPVAYLVWQQGRIAIDDVVDYFEVAKEGDKSVDGSAAFPVWDHAVFPLQEPVLYQHRFKPKGMSAYYWSEWKDGEARHFNGNITTLDIDERALYERPSLGRLVNRDSVLEEAAKLADAHAPFSEEAIRGSTSEAILDNSFGVTKSRLARQIAAAIRSMKSADTAKVEITRDMIVRGIKALDQFDYYDSQCGDYDEQRVKAILEAALQTSFDSDADEEKKPTDGDVPHKGFAVAKMISERMDFNLRVKDLWSDAAKEMADLIVNSNESAVTVDGAGLYLVSALMQNGPEVGHRALLGWFETELSALKKALGGWQVDGWSVVNYVCSPCDEALAAYIRSVPPVAWTNEVQIKKLADPNRWHEASMAPSGGGSFNVALYRQPVPALPAVPEGWKLVPTDPDQTMCDAGAPHCLQNNFTSMMVYKAMLEASPDLRSVSGHSSEGDAQ